MNTPQLFTTSDPHQHAPSPTIQQQEPPHQAAHPPTPHPSAVIRAQAVVDLLHVPTKGPSKKNKKNKQKHNTAPNQTHEGRGGFSCF